MVEYLMMFKVYTVDATGYNRQKSVEKITYELCHTMDPV